MEPPHTAMSVYLRVMISVGCTRASALHRVHPRGHLTCMAGLSPGSRPVKRRDRHGEQAFICHAYVMHTPCICHASLRNPPPLRAAICVLLPLNDIPPSPLPVCVENHSSLTNSPSPNPSPSALLTIRGMDRRIRSNRPRGD